MPIEDQDEMALPLADALRAQVEVDPEPSHKVDLYLQLGDLCETQLALAARAVEPFFTTREGAAGLGLSQAYAFARQCGGVLSIDSAPGEGAEVSIILPNAA